MSVSTQKQEYEDSIHKPELIRDCILGQDAIKSKETAYLPIPNGADSTGDATYIRYLKMAMFYNVVGKTHDALIGLAFRSKPDIEVAKELKYIKEEATSTGDTLQQFSKQIVSETLAYGRCGILVDYPSVDVSPSKQQKEDNYIRATLQYYSTFNIINWRETRMGSKSVLSLVVLTENIEVEDGDEFTYKTEVQYRVLKLNEQGNYIQQVYNKDDVKVGEDIEPKNANNEPFKYIPFVMLGCDCNNSLIDTSPMYDLAIMNIKHYQLYADNAFKMHLQAVPTLVLEGLDDNSIERLGSEIKLGTTTGILLGEGQTAQFLEIAESSALSTEIDKLENKMVALGARLIRDNVQETATTTKIKASTENSTLANVINNVNEAIKTALDIALDFESKSPKYDYNKFHISTNFTDQTLDATYLTSLLGALTNNVIPKRTVLEYLKSVGIIKKDEDIEKMIAEIEMNEDAVA